MRGIFITVRSGSTRLPNKALLNINGMPTIEHLIRRVKRSKLAELIVLCTTELQEDDVLCEIASRNNIKYFRGSVEDKLENNPWDANIKMEKVCTRYMKFIKSTME
jgi:spore coat polysaccharide biosynthesis protein SpsF